MRRASAATAGVTFAGTREVFRMWIGMLVLDARRSIRCAVAPARRDDRNLALERHEASRICGWPPRSWKIAAGSPPLRIINWPLRRNRTAAS
jgi:hypothetical protein